MAKPAGDLLLTRRSLLKVSALAGGGLLLGIGLPGRTDPLVSSEGDLSPDVDAVFAPNAWVRIHADGRVVVMLARSEMGQGVMTSLPTLIAEELEVGLDQIEVESAPVGKAYVNHLLGQQATGRSTSVRDAWTGLREAGALARTLLIQAAASVWEVPEAECEAHRGYVRHTDGERRLSYGELASTASALPVPEQVLLKGPGRWTLIGQRQNRLDTPAKVAGTARFGLDVRLPGMLVASIHRCAVLGSTVRSWRSEAARAIPGVIDVLAVRYGIAVVAEDTWSALRARELLEVDCRPRTNGAADSERIRSRFRARLGGRGAIARKDGDVSVALARGAIDIEVEYEVPFQAHACMEPMNCTADVRKDRCAVYVPTQAQGRVMETARRITELPEERITVHTTLLGGGFGRREEQDFVSDAVELSMRFGRPVQVVWTREDDLRHDFYRPMTLHRLRGGFDGEGNLVAWFHRVVGPSILSRVRPSAIRDGIDPTAVQGAADIPYAIPNLRVEYRRADTPVPIGFWRGAGYTQNAYVVECFLDELARVGGQDPLALRRRLLAASPRHLRVLDEVAERAGWGRPAPEGRARGIAFSDGFGSLVAQVAEVSVSAGQVRVHRVVCVIDCGRVVDPDGVRAQMEGGIVFGLTATLKGAVTLTDGQVDQRGFGDFALLRFDEMPEIEVHLLDSDADPGGASEPGTPPIAPAVANAVFAATGRPVRSLPIRLG